MMASISPSSATFSSPIALSSPVSPLRNTTDDICFTMDHEATVLAMAILSGNVRQVEALLRHGATLLVRYYWTLYQACLHGADIVNVLMAFPGIDFHARIDVCDPLFHLVLRTPCSRFSNSKTKVVKLLLRHGADPFITNRLGETALYIFATLSTEEDIQLLYALLRNNSGPLYCINDRNLYGDTALIIAVICGNKEVAKGLLELRADPNCRGEHDATALDYAVREGDAELVALLIAVGAKAGDDMDLGSA